jgi:replicative DNA helicase
MTGKLPPHSTEAEQGVLGCVLWSPREALDTAIERGVTSEWFYDLRHADLWREFHAMHSDQVPVDLITVQQRLRDANQLESVGGLPYLSSLMDAVPSAANLTYYLDILRDQMRKRQVLKFCAEAERLSRTDEPADGLLDELESNLLGIRGEHTDAHDPSAKDIAREVIDELEARHNGASVGLKTGFHRFDALVGGLRPGRCYVIAARPGCGKTAWAINAAVNVAREGGAVGFISLEMDRKEIGERIVASLGQVDTSATGKRSEDDFRKLTIGANKLGKLPLHIDDRNATVSGIRAKLRRWKRTHKIALGVVDYLGLVGASSGGSTRKDRREEVDEISRGMKAVAKELGIPIIVVAQLNRELEKDKNRKPRLADLRESGQIEQDAHVVAFLYRTTEDDGPRPQEAPVKMLVAKNRSGRSPADIHFTFNGSTMTFAEATPPIAPTDWAP